MLSTLHTGPNKMSLPDLPPDNPLEDFHISVPSVFDVPTSTQVSGRLELIIYICLIVLSKYHHLCVLAGSDLVCFYNTVQALGGTNPNRATRQTFKLQPDSNWQDTMA